MTSKTRKPSPSTERRQFSLSPLGLLQLRTYLSMSEAVRPVFIHTIRHESASLFGDVNKVVVIRSVGKFDDVLECAEKCEKEQAYLPAATSKKSAHVGRVGETIEEVFQLYARGIWPITEYGLSYFYRLHDRKGNELTWTTEKLYEIGEYAFRCRVKAHQTYGGIRQTAVNYVKEI